MYGPSITHNEKHCQKTTLKLDESLKSSFLFIPPPPFYVKNGNMHVSDMNFAQECIKNINEDNVTHVTTGYKLWLP